MAGSPDLGDSIRMRDLAPTASRIDFSDFVINAAFVSSDMKKNSTSRLLDRFLSAFSALNCVTSSRIDSISAREFGSISILACFKILMNSPRQLEE